MTINPNITKSMLVQAGFTKGMGGGDWYFPNEGYPHIHLNAPGAYDHPEKKDVLFISISRGDRAGKELEKYNTTHGGDTYIKFNIDTPNVFDGITNEDRTRLSAKLEELRTAAGRPKN